MKKIVVVVCLLIPFCSSAQYSINASAGREVMTQNEVLTFKNSLSKALNADVPGSRKKRKGAILMIAGGVLLISGAVLFSDSDKHLSLYLNESNSNGTYGASDQKAEAGALLMAGGLGMAIPGLIIYSKGNRQYQAYKAENTVSLHLRGAGFALRWKL